MPSKGMGVHGEHTGDQNAEKLLKSTLQRAGNTGLLHPRLIRSTFHQIFPHASRSRSLRFALSLARSLSSVALASSFRLRPSFLHSSNRSSLRCRGAALAQSRGPIRLSIRQVFASASMTLLVRLLERPFCCAVYVCIVAESNERGETESGWRGDSAAASP